jgi:hypothetical protein
MVLVQRREIKKKQMIFSDFGADGSRHFRGGNEIFIWNLIGLRHPRPRRFIDLTPKKIKMMLE